LAHGGALTPTSRRLNEKGPSYAAADAVQTRQFFENFANWLRLFAALAEHGYGGDVAVKLGTFFAALEPFKPSCAQRRILVTIVTNCPAALAFPATPA
jgi:hypothetical protein